MVFMQNVSQIHGLGRTGSLSLSLPPSVWRFFFFGEASFVLFFIRWAFIDLSAGPFSWGPAVGGEGVRTELSLPNVGKTIGAAAGFRSFRCKHFSHKIHMHAVILLVGGGATDLVILQLSLGDVRIP